MENTENNNWHDGEIQPEIHYSIIYEYSNDMEHVFALDAFFKIPDGTKEIEGIQVQQFRDADDKKLDFPLIFQREFNNSPYTLKDQIKTYLEAEIKILLKGFEGNNYLIKCNADIYARAKRFIEWLSETNLSDLPDKQSRHIIDGELFKLAYEVIQELCMNNLGRDELFKILNDPSGQTTWKVKPRCKGRFNGLIRILSDKIAQKDRKRWKESIIKMWPEYIHSYDIVSKRDAGVLVEYNNNYIKNRFPDLAKGYKSNR